MSNLIVIPANELLEGADVSRIEDLGKVMTYEINVGKELNLIIYAKKMRILAGT